jgi:hypothetical protein
MNPVACPDLGDLVAYRVGELDGKAEESLEAHLFDCDRCTTLLETVEELRRGTSALVRSGALTVGATAELIDYAAASGVRIRGYSVDVGAEVPCTIAPDDDFIAVRLRAGLESGERVDMEVVSTIASTGERTERLVEDALTDPRSGDVSFLYAGELVRSMPKSEWTMHLSVSGRGATRRLGPFTLKHSPWGESPDSRQA